MKSKDGVYKKVLPKLEVLVLPFDSYGGKRWVKVKLESNSWVPSFEEIFWILKAISYCENEKFPPEEGFQGWKMVANFVRESCSPGANFEELAKKYKLPKRN